MDIKIEKNIPPPEEHWKRKYPLNRMEVGDSFAIPKSEAARVRNAIWSHCKVTDHKYKSRVEGENVRVWRVK
jgi:hypothetical protein